MKGGGRPWLTRSLTHFRYIKSEAATLSLTPNSVQKGFTYARTSPHIQRGSMCCEVSTRAFVYRLSIMCDDILLEWDAQYRRLQGRLAPRCGGQESPQHYAISELAPTQVLSPSALEPSLWTRSRHQHRSRSPTPSPVQPPRWRGSPAPVDSSSSLHFPNGSFRL
mmetsp:Transcript_8116/g.13092  ORF Transcript_8116/g.13092 Transcript_8116/m.13092 type:complete len:165 (-) Transcript_8116:296-790(-)